MPVERRPKGGSGFLGELLVDEGLKYGCFSYILKLTIRLLDSPSIITFCGLLNMSFKTRMNLDIYFGLLDIKLSLSSIFLCKSFLYFNRYSLVIAGS